MKKLTLAAALFLSAPCFALLSPLNQSIEEIKTIVTSAELQNFLPQDQQIKRIERTATGYVLTTDKLQTLVEIHFIPTTYPGRQQFKLSFHEPKPLRY